MYKIHTEYNQTGGNGNENDNTNSFVVNKVALSAKLFNSADEFRICIV